MSNQKYIVVSDQAFGNVNLEREAAKSVGASFRDYQCQTEAETAEAVLGAHVVLNNFAPMTKKVMAHLAENAVIIRYGVGVDNVDLKAATELGVRVCNVPDYGIEEVADHAAAMSLALSRHLPAYDTAIRKGIWSIPQTVSFVRSLQVTTVGIIGVGRIARSYAKKMQAFGCQIIGYDPYIAIEEAKKAQIILMELEEVIKNAHIISLHVPLNAETHNLINTERIALMQDGAILVNVSRGGLIDEVALAEGLESNKLGGAGLDVFVTEPLTEDTPLKQAPNLLLSPHAAFYSDNSVTNLQRLASEEALRAIRNEPLRCQVN